jgi:hypothetical protein
MFNYFFDTREYTEILQYLSLFLLFVIGTMVYYLSTDTNKMNQDIKDDIANLDLECPKCPEHPEIPACPKCPDLTCDTDGRCPECPDCPKNPVCPTLPEVNCPNVEDIVSGIFPGRNPGITSGGKYFDIKASESYELMPDYDFYSPVEAFPSDSILSIPDSLIKGNIDIPPTQIDNSIDNNNINTSTDVSLSRMHMSSSGENTGPSSISQRSLSTSGSANDSSDP